MIYLIIFSISYAIIRAKEDANYLRFNHVSHTLGFVSTALLFAFILSMPLIAIKYFTINDLIWYYVAMIAPYWWTFDHSIALFLKKGFFYRGKESFFDRYYGWFYILKCILWYFTIIITIEYYR